MDNESKENMIYGLAKINGDKPASDMTKREFLTAAALMWSGSHFEPIERIEDVAIAAVVLADEMLKSLEVE